MNWLTPPLRPGTWAQSPRVRRGPPSIVLAADDKATTPRLCSRAELRVHAVEYGLGKLAGAITAEAALSFLGLGTQRPTRPTPAWGSMLNPAQSLT